MIINKLISNPNDRLKIWKVNIDSDKSARTQLAKDDWLKEHRADNGLIVVAYPNFEVSTPDTNNYIILSKGMNFTPIQDLEQYGNLSNAYIKSDGTSSGTVLTGTYGIGTTLTTGARYLRIETTGILNMNANATYKIPAGEWIVFAIILEGFDNDN